MADTKISALTAVSAVADTNQFATNEAGASKSTTVGNIFDTYPFGLKLPGHITSGTVTGANLGASGTANAIMSLSLDVGSYLLEAFLCIQSGATGTGIGFSIAFDGTIEKTAMQWRYLGNSTTGAVGVVSTSNTANVVAEGQSKTTISGSGTDVECTGFQAASAGSFCIIKAIIVVSASGTLQLMFNSETATQVLVLIGSNWRVTKFN